MLDDKGGYYCLKIQTSFKQTQIIYCFAIFLGQTLVGHLLDGVVHPPDPDGGVARHSH